MEFPVIDYEEWGEMGRYINLEDGKLFYVHKGKGFPVIMTHSFGRSSWWFSRVLDVFAEQYSVYVLDLPGWGRSDTPPLPYNIPDFAYAEKEFMDKLGIDKAHLVGCSGSTQMNVHFSTTWPSRVAKLVLDAFTHWNRVEAKRYWLERFQAVEGRLDRPYEEWFQRTEPNQEFMFLEDGIREIAVERNIRGFEDHRQWWLDVLKVGQLKYDVNTRLHLIQAPTLLISGEVGPEYVVGGLPKKAEAIHGSRVEIIPEAGVLSAFEQPEIYSRLVLEFLSSPE